MLTVGPYDTDNDALPAFGTPAGVADSRAIAALIGRYYAAAARGEAGRACAMQWAVTREALIEEHHHGKGPRSLRGETCTEIMAKMFGSRRRELVEDAARQRVLAVQVRENRGYALVRFGMPSQLREVEILFHRLPAGGWEMAVPLDKGAQ